MLRVKSTMDDNTSGYLWGYRRANKEFSLSYTNGSENDGDGNEGYLTVTM